MTERAVPFADRTRVLEMIRDDWGPRHLLPVLADEPRLRSTRAAQEHELSEQQERLVEDQHLRRARERYDAGDLAAAARAHTGCDPARLSAADRRRFHVARRRSPQ